MTNMQTLWYDSSGRQKFRVCVHLIIINIIMWTAMLALSYKPLQCTFLTSHSFWIKIPEFASLAVCNCTHKPVLWSKITTHAEFIFGVYCGHAYFVRYSTNAKIKIITQTSPIHELVQEVVTITFKRKPDITTLSISWLYERMLRRWIQCK
jgi:hypothetical protein